MLEGISVTEAVQLGATNLRLYGRLFFPRTFRQPSPPFHDDMGSKLDGPSRYVAFKVFRGGAKTALVRVFVSKRVAYGISRTILIVSETLAHSIRSVRWLRRQVQFNKEWAGAFGLRMGEKWTDEEIQIYHGVEEIPITVLAVGITGQTRGVNIEDYRPDLIVVDDPCDDENTKTEEQRKKTETLIFGALYQSLAPPTEAPLAKLAILQTPLVSGDIIDKASKDPAFETAEFSCFDEHGQSRWEARFPTAYLKGEKQKFIQRGQLALWTREMEVKIISTEMSSFRRAWLRYWTDVPEYMRICIGIDPASSEDPRADKMVAAAVGQYGKKIFVLDYVAAPKNDQTMFLEQLFGLIMMWHPMMLVVEGIGFQRTIKKPIEDMMRVKQIWVAVHMILGDKRAKGDRLIHTYATSGIAPYGNLYLRPGMSEFEEQFETFSPMVENKDDYIDAVSRAIEFLLGLGQHTIEGEFTEVEEEDERLLGGPRPVNAMCP